MVVCYNSSIVKVKVYNERVKMCCFHSTGFLGCVYIHVCMCVCIVHFTPQTLVTFLPNDLILYIIVTLRK